MTNRSRENEIRNQYAQQEYTLKKNLIIYQIRSYIENQPQPVNEFNIVTRITDFSPDAIRLGLDELVGSRPLDKTFARDGRPQYRLPKKI